MQRRKDTGNRPKVLLSEGSSTSARQVIYALGGRYRLGLMDPARLCQCRFSRFIDTFHRCPSYSKQPIEYLKAMATTIRQGGYDVVFPTHEQVYLLARFRETLSRHVGVALPDFDALRRLQKKSDFVRILEELDLPGPPSRIVGSFAELEDIRRLPFEFPFFVKLPHSTAGNGVRLVRDAESLRRTAAEFAATGQLDGVTEIVVQQPVEGVQSVVQAVFQHGRMIGIHCAEALQVNVGGGHTLRVSVSHPNVVEDVRRLGQHLQWHGALFLEYFYDRATGRPWYIEANPRIGETVNAMLCGVNLCDMLVRISLGEQLQPVAPSRDIVRSHTGFLLLITAAMRGANRRELLAEMWRVWRSKGPYANSENEITRPREDLLSLIPAMATGLQLLACPKSATGIVKRTVDNYSLPEAGALQVESLAASSLDACFES